MNIFFPKYPLRIRIGTHKCPCHVRKVHDPTYWRLSFIMHRCIPAKFSSKQTTLLCFICILLCAKEENSLCLNVRSQFVFSLFLHYLRKLNFLSWITNCVLFMPILLFICNRANNTNGIRLIPTIEGIVKNLLIYSDMHCVGIAVSRQAHILFKYNLQ